jgi:hypothetical protein
MNRKLFLVAIATLLVMHVNSHAQSQDLRKFEVGIEYANLAREAFGQHQMEAGVGARFTFNLNRIVAFETAGYFYPHQCNFCPNGGNVSQVVAGAKIGKRFEKWGIFGKARPGVVSFSQGEFIPIIINPFGPIEGRSNSVTSFAADLGGVLEFYPTDRIVTRFDAGDTIIHFGRRTTNGVGFNFTTNEFFLIPITRPARTTHNFQFTAGVGFRF